MSSCKSLAFAIHVLFVLGTCLLASEANFFPPPCPSAPPPPSINTATYYLQAVIANGTNNAVANVFPVAGVQGRQFTLQEFGTIFVVDANITTTPSPTSTLVGQAFGTLVAVSLDGTGYSVQVSLTNVFTSGPLAGSTLVVLGVSNGAQQQRPVPIVGGTGALTYATGYVVYQTISQQGPNLIIEVTAYYKTL
ncbi:hypothetical protein MLD38_009113 [Melastoma candidum]|uniref:Uncharacterized protein n=1 Tax=Melastoma candidum TaxID=119954 RepID=A0ACB9RVY6_9MYRT|nr:hypothetical protein MLD38_009113 [Melastoma candidum]